MNRGGVLDWAGVVLLSGCAALAGLLELLYVPLYSGRAVVPVAVVAALVSNLVLPRLARALVPTAAAALMPFLTWLLVVAGIGLMARPEGDVILPGGGGAVQWVSYGVLLGGAVAGTLSVALGGTVVRPTVDEELPERQLNR